MYPIKKICDKCGRPFDASTTNQTTCMQCMVRPTRRPELKPTELKPPELKPPRPKENNMKDFSKTVRKEKNCIDCKEAFIPTGNNTKYCPKCIQKKTHKAKVKHSATVHPLGKTIIEKLLVPQGIVDAAVRQTKSGLSAPLTVATKHNVLMPSLTANCTMQDAVAIFRGLAEAGCSSIVFGTTKITIEAL